MPDVVWLDGAVLPAVEARVPALDRGLTVGDGVFETLKAIDGRAFAVRRHLERLRRSAAGLVLEVPLSDDELRAAVDAVARAVEAPLARIRITATAGPAPLGLDRVGPPTVTVAGGALEPAPPVADVCVAPWPRNERSPVAGVKTTSGADHVATLAWARSRGCSEALSGTTDGRLCEGTSSNVFVVLGGRLVTPTLATGCLAGVTRALVVELTGAAEEDLPVGALADADEVFLTSTTRDVQAVRSVDGRALEAPGPVTQQAIVAFAALVQRDLDPSP